MHWLTMWKHIVQLVWGKYQNRKLQPSTDSDYLPSGDLFKDTYELQAFSLKSMSLLQQIAMCKLTILSNHLTAQQARESVIACDTASPL